MASAFIEKREIEDADVEETKSFLPHLRRHEKPATSRNPIILLFFTTLNVTGLFVLYLLLVPLKSQSPFKTPVPEIEYEIRSFTEEYNRDTSVVEVWDTEHDYPPFEGMTFVENPTDYDLPPGVAINGKANRYGTAWTHQYHCLELIHSSYEAFVHNITLSAHGAHRRSTDEDQKAADIHHMRHCFDYLRQHIICSMDMRLEYPTTNPKGINGYAIPRKCVKRGPLDTYMSEHGRQPL